MFIAVIPTTRPADQSPAYIGRQFFRSFTCNRVIVLLFPTGRSTNTRRACCKRLHKRAAAGSLGDRAPTAPMVRLQSLANRPRISQQ